VHFSPKVTYFLSVFQNFDFLIPYLTTQNEVLINYEIQYFKTFRICASLSKKYLESDVVEPEPHYLWKKRLPK
jgi:hypothetical protein